jgi:hypothetical protein
MEIVVVVVMEKVMQKIHCPVSRIIWILSCLRRCSNQQSEVWLRVGERKNHGW